jgi:hypothetical protein
MKHIIFFVCLCSSIVAFGQWNNSGNNYTTGRVAIGTSTIGKMLEVRANEADHLAYLGNTHPSGYGLFLYASNDPLRIVPMDSNPDYLFVVNGSGKVGVGVSNPVHQLQVGSLSTTTPVVAIGKINADTGGKSKLMFYAGSGAYANGFSVEYRKTSAVDKLVFVDGGNVETMTIVNGGNVGIGSTAPDAKLAVKGIVHAQEVRVDTSVPGPDYVFDSNYNLPTVEQVKAFIEENHHLPEVPSAKEMEADGILVGAMNLLLLKKIEELTLYVIDLKTELDEMKKKVK